MSFNIFSRVPQFPSQLKTIDVLSMITLTSPNLSSLMLALSLTIDVLSMITLTSMMRDLEYCYSAISCLKFLKDFNLRKIELTSR